MRLRSGGKTNGNYKTPERGPNLQILGIFILSRAHLGAY